MSVGQSTSPGLERASDRRELTEVLGRVEQLERVPAARYATQFGSSHQSLPLQYAGSPIPDISGVFWDGFEWITDPTSFRCGYAEATTEGAFFSGLVLLEPKGSVWHFNNRRSEGPDFGKYTISLASLVYESPLRGGTLADQAGKIGPSDGSYAGSEPPFAYVDLATADAYASVAVNDYAPETVNPPFIVGGEVGDPLTDFVTGITDPFLGFQLMDGGPGWYRLRVMVEGQNPSSTGFRCRISEAILTRRSDENSF